VTSSVYRWYLLGLIGLAPTEDQADTLDVRELTAWAIGSNDSGEQGVRSAQQVEDGVDTLLGGAPS
jgi:hypothetical protein